MLRIHRLSLCLLSPSLFMGCFGVKTSFHMSINLSDHSLLLTHLKNDEIMFLWFRKNPLIKHLLVKISLISSRCHPCLYKSVNSSISVRAFNSFSDPTNFSTTFTWTFFKSVVVASLLEVEKLPKVVIYNNKQNIRWMMSYQTNLHTFYNQ